MDRLTWEYIEGGFYVDGTEISPSDFEGHVVYYGPAVDRLAAYEASGKSPEEVAQMYAENARIRAEQDMVVEDLNLTANCDVCKHYDADEISCAKPTVDSYSCFEWRGPQEAREGE